MTEAPNFFKSRSNIIERMSGEDDSFATLKNRLLLLIFHTCDLLDGENIGGIDATNCPGNTDPQHADHCLSAKTTLDLNRSNLLGAPDKLPSIIKVRYVALSQ
jgi:hypothetical protein